MTLSGSRNLSSIAAFAMIIKWVLSYISHLIVGCLPFSAPNHLPVNLPRHPSLPCSTGASCAYILWDVHHSDCQYLEVENEFFHFMSRLTWQPFLRSQLSSSILFYFSSLTPSSFTRGKRLLSTSGRPVTSFNILITEMPRSPRPHCFD